MNPFLRALVAAGLLDEATADRMGRALSPAEAQAYAEQRVAAAFAQNLSGQLGRLTDVLRSNEFNLPAEAAERFWQSEAQIMARDVIPVLQETASEMAINATMRGGGFNMWNTVNTEVTDWVKTYYTSLGDDAVGSLPNLMARERVVVGDAFNRWHNGTLGVPADGRGLPRLIEALEPAFGPERAARIAITEVTRIHTESEVTAARADDTVEFLEWQAANDEFVCKICGPLHGRRIQKGAAGFGGGVTFPPAHPNCRCSVVPLGALAAEAIDRMAAQSAT